jgi:hypothetical protein
MQSLRLAGLLTGALVLFLACSEAPLIIGQQRGVKMVRFAVDDAAPRGNGDGVVNPGERVRLASWLKNVGADSAKDVDARLRLSSPSEFVTLFDSVLALGNLASRESVYAESAFQFSVALNCTNGYELPLQLVCSSSDTQTVNPYALAIGVLPVQPVQRVVLAELITESG